jgi:hypothetical protein
LGAESDRSPKDLRYREQCFPGAESVVFETAKKGRVPQVSRFSRPGISQSRQAWDFVKGSGDQLGAVTTGGWFFVTAAIVLNSPP